VIVSNNLLAVFRAGSVVRSINMRKVQFQYVNGIVLRYTNTFIGLTLTNIVLFTQTINQHKNDKIV
jgi:hypothetical protein